jgi:hypothetical protein
VEAGVSEISTGERYYLNSQLRDAAIVLDEAEHRKVLEKGDANFMMATGILRGWRRAIESSSERETVVRHLKESDDELSLVGGASAVEAVRAARRLVADAHFKLASARGE